MLLIKGGKWRVEGEQGGMWRLYENDGVIDEDENPVLIYRAFIGRIEGAFRRQVKPVLERIGYDWLFGTYNGEPLPDEYDALLEQRRREHEKACRKVSQ